MGLLAEIVLAFRSMGIGATGTLKGKYLSVMDACRGVSAGNLTNATVVMRSLM